MKKKKLMMAAMAACVATLFSSHTQRGRFSLCTFYLICLEIWLEKYIFANKLRNATYAKTTETTEWNRYLSRNAAWYQPAEYF